MVLKYSTVTSYSPACSNTLYTCETVNLQSEHQDWLSQNCKFPKALKIRYFYNTIHNFNLNDLRNGGTLF